MNGNDIVGGVFLLLLMLVVSFFSTPVGMAILAALIVVAMVATAYVYYSDYEPWTTFEPSKHSRREVLAQGYMDNGIFVLSRERVPGGYDGYPRIVTLNLFNLNGELVSSVAKIVERIEDDGKYIIGEYRGRNVIIDSGKSSNARYQLIGKPNGYDTWQVFPPQAEIPFRISPPR